MYEELNGKNWSSMAKPWTQKNIALNSYQMNERKRWRSRKIM